MAKEKPLYISVDEPNYKKSKAGMLNSQIDLLNSMKHLQTLKEIKDEKFKLKLRLYSLFSSFLADMEKLDEKLPEVGLPKEQKEPHEKVRMPVVKKPVDPRRAGIESELQEIREKLRKLNSG